MLPLYHGPKRTSVEVCALEGSNLRPSASQADALPAELRGFNCSKLLPGVEPGLRPYEDRALPLTP